MKALSIRQPWAQHASKGMTKHEWNDAMDFVDGTFPLDRENALCRRARCCNSPKGGIIGLVDVVGCVMEHDSPWFFGRFGILLVNPRPVHFIPFKGLLGLFNVPDELVRLS